MINAVVHDLAHVVHHGFHPRCGNVTGLADVVRASDSDVGIHVLHLGELMLGDEFVLLIGGSEQQLTCQQPMFHFEHRHRFASPDFPDQGNAEFIGHITEVKHDFLALFDIGGISYELACELGDARIFHGHKIQPSVHRSQEKRYFV